MIYRNVYAIQIIVTSALTLFSWATEMASVYKISEVNSKRHGLT